MTLPVVACVVFCRWYPLLRLYVELAGINLTLMWLHMKLLWLTFVLWLHE